MIRGYTAIINRDSPLPAIPSWHRMTGVKLSTVDTFTNSKVVQNIEMVDKDRIDRGLVRIGFIKPELDVVISCNPGELITFVDTIEVVKDLVSDYYESEIQQNIICSCLWRGDKTRQCLTCVKRLACSLPNSDDIASNPQMLRFPVTSFPYLMSLHLNYKKLEDIPESLGLLPCLSELDLSHNLLGDTTNWNFLTSPFLRENLSKLNLCDNRIRRLPDAIGGLTNLRKLWVKRNSLTDLPDTMRKLKNLRDLRIGWNKLRYLPSWLYRWERIRSLVTAIKDFDKNMYKNEQQQQRQLTPKDFQETGVSSLFDTVANFIITERLPYWEYNIPPTLTDHLESMYRCFCGARVFPNTSGQIVRCWVTKASLGKRMCGRKFYDLIPIAIQFCSYDCFREFEHF